MKKALTKDEVQAIYELCWQQEHPVTLIQVAREAGCSKQTVWRIKTKRYRKDWTDEVDATKGR